MTANIRLPLPAASSSSKPPSCALGFGTIVRENVSAAPTDVATPLLIPEHNLRRPGAAAEVVSEFFRKLCLTPLECLLRLLDLFLQLLRSFARRKLVANAFEEVEGRFACGEIVGQFPDGHDTLH